MPLDAQQQDALDRTEAAATRASPDDEQLAPLLDLRAKSDKAAVARVLDEMSDGTIAAVAQAAIETLNP